MKVVFKGELVKGDHIDIKILASSRIFGSIGSTRGTMEPHRTSNMSAKISTPCYCLSNAYFFEYLNYSVLLFEVAP